MRKKSSVLAAPALVCLILSFFCFGGAISSAAAWLQTPLRAIAFSPDGTHLYLADPYRAGVDVIDTATNQIVSTLTFRNAGAPGALAISPDGAQLYGADAANSQLEIINLAMGKVVARVKVGQDPTALAVSPDVERVYVLNHYSHTVSVVDPKADKLVATIPVGMNPGDLVVRPDGRRVYVSITGSSPVYATNPRGGTVLIIDTAKNVVTETLPVYSAPFALAISPEGQRLYVTHDDRASSVVDIIHTVPPGRDGTLPGGYASAIAISPDAKRLYVLSTDFNLVAAIDLTSGQVVGAAPAGSLPLAMAVSPDGRRLYVEDLGSGRQRGSLSVIDAATLQVVATIQL